MEGSLHNVAEIPEAARSALEGLVGHSLGNDDVLYIATLGSSTPPAQADHGAAWDELETIVAQMRQNAAKSGLSDEQIDLLLDAECDAIRSSRRT